MKRSVPDMVEGRSLVAAIAVRNASSRLYAKPLQNIDIDARLTIVEALIDCMASTGCVDQTYLAIADAPGSEAFVDLARKIGVAHILGDEDDVLSRLIGCAEASGCTDVLRLSSESPFLHYDYLETLWPDHARRGLDATFLDNVIDGCGFEIMARTALEDAHRRATKPDHYEHCSMYIREHHDRYRIERVFGPPELDRRDLRLTVDHPEDLVICRRIYRALKDKAPRIPIPEIVKLLDANPDWIHLIAPFTEHGYASMFAWGEKENE